MTFFYFHISFREMLVKISLDLISKVNSKDESTQAYLYTRYPENLSIYILLYHFVMLSHWYSNETLAVFVILSFVLVLLTLLKLFVVCC